MANVTIELSVRNDYYLGREDYYICDHVNDAYEYDKEEVYRICKDLFKDHKKKEYILGYIKGNLPEYPKED